jgi:uncharacterized protein (DUF2062 family)
MSIPETKTTFFKVNKNNKIGLLRWLRYNYLKLLRINTDPTIFARGIAIGVFIGLTPTIPFHTVLMLLLSILSRGHFFAGLIVSYIICNPLTMPLIYYASWFTGKIFIHSEIDGKVFADFISLIIHLKLGDSIELLKKMGFDFLITLNIGGIIFAAPFGILSYWIALKSYGLYQKKRYERFKLAVLKK